MGHKDTSNALVKQRQLWPDGVGDQFYWYSVLDGIMLLRAMRKEKLNYNIENQDQLYPVSGNDDLAAIRENAAHIFVADPYAGINFESAFGDDIAVITGTHSSFKNKWAHMPTTLILSVISGSHWRAINIQIDYEECKVKIIWDDPYGETHFPLQLRQRLLPILKKEVTQLFQIHKNQLEIMLDENNFIEETRAEDLQGVGCNFSDCGPIIFSNIQDYVEAAITQTVVKFSVTPASELTHNDHLRYIRYQHQLIYRQMFGAQGNTIPLTIKAKSAHIEKIYLTEKYSVDTDKLLTDPYWAGIFHAYIENYRIKNKKKLDEAYSDKEKKKAYQFVLRQKNDEVKRYKEEAEKANFNSNHSLRLHDPFAWHVRRHFSGILERTEKLDNETLKNYLKVLLQEVKRLSESGQFKQAERDVRELFLKRLRTHVIRKMAFQLSGTTADDKTAKEYMLLPVTDKKYADRLTRYYKYTNDVHKLNGLLLSSKKSSTYALTSAVDIVHFGEIDDDLWQTHITYTVLDLIQTALFQENQYSFLPEMYKDGMSSHVLILQDFCDEKDNLMRDVLRAHQLEESINGLLVMEQSFVERMLSTVSSELLAYENKRPGFYLSLVHALYKRNNESTTSAEEKLKISKLLTKFQLQKTWLEFEKSELPELRNKLDAKLKPILASCKQQFTDYHEQIDDYRLQLYAEYMANEEHDIIRNIAQPYDDAWQKYNEECAEINDDPDSAEWDYDEVVRPNTPAPCPIMQSFYKDLVPTEYQLGSSPQYFPESKSSLTNPHNLIAVCGGNENLAWLAHQYAEYEIEIWEELLEAIDFESLNLDPDIAAYILRTTFLDHTVYPNEILEDGFIPKVFARFVEELETSEDVDLNNPFLMPSLRQFAETIKTNFVQLLEDGKIKKLRARFNDAYHRQDWVEVQRLWPVFTKFQRLLVSTEEVREKSKKFPKYSFPVKGPDYDFGKEKHTDYKELLKKAWKQYKTRADTHYYRIYLNHNAHILKYSSSRHIEKEATFDIAPLLGALETVGLAIEDKLVSIGEKSGNKSNIVTAALCFVVTNKPHQKNGNHRRIFVLINLDLLLENNVYLLSKDFEDGVFPNREENYFKQQANEDYQAGLNTMGKQGEAITGEHNSKLYHSERVLLEVLRTPVHAKKIAELLHQKLESILGHALESGKYKVYATALIMYSSNSICNLCTPSLIALQSSHQQGFLKNLTDALNNENTSFKTRGYVKEKLHQPPEKFPMLTIVTSGTPWTEQAHELHETSVQTPNESKTMKNPKGILHMVENAIDLNTCGWNEQGVRYSYHRSLIEFVGKKFSKAVEPSQNKMTFFFSGNSFMSGSKKEKFGDKVEEVNKSIADIMRLQQ